MAEYYSDDWLTIYQGDVRAVLPALPADSVDCIVTSPPYWGLRDYGSDGQLGLERTPEEYVANLVGVFRELRRVLKPSGTCWLNLGDTFSSRGGAGGTMSASGLVGGEKRQQPRPEASDPEKFGRWNRDWQGLKPKDLCGIPWRVAFALQADGWYLRSDIIWAKPNPMPESVTDRPTKAHEYLFLLTKSARYYYDADAVREANVTIGDKREGSGRHEYTGKWDGAGDEQQTFVTINPAGRNLRSVWTIATRPYPGAHFAVFPPELPERCIKAGSSERGVCPECGAPWERVVNKSRTFESGSGKAGNLPVGKNGTKLQGGGETGDIRRGPVLHTETTGWQPTCGCRCKTPADHPECVDGVMPPMPALVVDPFGGSGTVGMVANRLSRAAILIDLNGDYLKQQLKRNAQTPLGLTHG